MQTVQPNFVIPAMLTGTIDFYHFILLSLTLTLPGGHKVSAKRNLLASFSSVFSSRAVAVMGMEAKGNVAGGKSEYFF